LNGIFLMVEVLRRELAGRAELAETLEDLEVMRRSILETVGTMDRFLYAERFRKRKVKVRPAPMSLRTLLVEIGSRFTYAARDQEIELKIDIAERADIVNDRELLALALHGLVANAVRNTKQGSVVLSAKPLESGEGWRVEVIDSGSGIAPELLEQICAGFRNPALGMPGTGLGLSLASQACRVIGAMLGAESRVGEGSRFWIEVPGKV
jgi:signal transduction histidine kinase